MANHKHVDILSKGVIAWNRWRDQNPDIKPNLSGTNLCQANLAYANLRQTDLRKADLRAATLNDANFFKTDLRAANFKSANMVASDLRGANLKGAHLIFADMSKTDLKKADMRGTRLDDAILNETNLESANLGDAYLPGAHLISANLNQASLRGCNLQDTVFTMAIMTGADLSLANLTGAHLYGTERDHWKIDGIKCRFAHWDKDSSQRTPATRDFKPGEFELLYRKSPTIEYRFDEGFAPLQILLMDHAVKIINNRLPEFELHLDSLIFKGAPRAIFSVLHRKDCPKALELIGEHYHEQLKLSETIEMQACIDKWDRRMP